MKLRALAITLSISLIAATIAAESTTAPTTTQPATQSATAPADRTDAHYLAAYHLYREAILKSALKGDTEEVRKATEAFQKSSGNALFYASVQRLADAKANKWETVFSEWYADQKVAFPKIKYAGDRPVHVTRWNEGLLKYVLIEPGGTNGRYADDVYVRLAMRPKGLRGELGAAETGKVRAAHDIELGKAHILYYGMPWSAGKPLIDEESGLAMEIAEGCCVLPEKKAELDAYNAVVRAWAKKQGKGSH